MLQCWQCNHQTLQAEVQLLVHFYCRLVQWISEVNVASVWLHIRCAICLEPNSLLTCVTSCDSQICAFIVIMCDGYMVIVRLKMMSLIDVDVRFTWWKFGCVCKQRQCQPADKSTRISEHHCPVRSVPLLLTVLCWLHSSQDKMVPVVIVLRQHISRFNITVLDRTGYFEITG